MNTIYILPEKLTKVDTGQSSEYDVIVQTWGVQ